MHNPTQYQEELAMLTVKENGSYTENSEFPMVEECGNQMATKWQPNGNQMATQVRLGKDSIGKVSIDKDIYNNKLTNLTIERLFERYFGRTPFEYETESIMDWSESLNVELVGEDIALADVAFRLAAEARTENKMKYIAGIYRKWKSAGVASMDDYETYQAEYDIANGRI